jgi:hypothetical protein
VPKEKPEPSAEEAAARELVRLARALGLSLTGPEGLLKQFTKSVLETALSEEMTEHLGHEKHKAPDERDSTNVRNGTRPKTVLTEATAQVEIDVPRDRDGSFLLQTRPARVASESVDKERGVLHEAMDVPQKRSSLRLVLGAEAARENSRARPARWRPAMQARWC